MIAINDKIVTIKLRRRQLIYLMVACSHMVAAWSRETKKRNPMDRPTESLAMWQDLHDELDTQLKEWDLKQRPHPEL